MSTKLTTARWSDWIDIPLFGAPWAIGSSLFGGTWAPLDGLNTSTDIIDSQHGIGSPTIGLYAARPQFTRGFSSLQWRMSLSLPNFVLGAQRRRAPEWTGLEGDPMAENAGLRTAMLIENVLSSPNFIAPLNTFIASVTFNGFGFGPEKTSDVAVTNLEPLGLGASAFPDMSIPPGDGSTGDRVSFPQGDAPIARIWTLVELPETVALGDFADIAFFLVDQEGAGSVLQWRTSRYCFITPPYPILPNTTVQLVDDEAQPRLDFSSYEP
jgi:hypothetical protein